MPIKITINGEPATANQCKDELELMLHDGLTGGLTWSVLAAIIAEVQTETAMLDARRNPEEPGTRDWWA